MANIVLQSRIDDKTAIFIAAGEYFFISEPLPAGLEEFAEINEDGQNNTKLTFKQDVIAVVDNLHPSRRRAVAVLFVRPARVAPGTTLRWINILKRHDSLHEAVSAAEERGYPVVFSPQNAVRYSDETVVFHEGSLHFLTRERIDELLGPPADDGRIVSLYVDQGDINSSDFDVSVVGDLDEVKNIAIQVDYDAGSGVVKKIFYVDDSEEIDQVLLAWRPRPRFVRLGERLPYYLFQPHQAA